jgi:hypothetical protein
MDCPNAMHPGVVREETCAIRQDAFCKVHRKFVTVNASPEAPFFCSEYAANTGQIIYILKRLVTKKNVTVVREKASPRGDTLFRKIRSRYGLQRTSPIFRQARRWSATEKKLRNSTDQFPHIAMSHSPHRAH